jgi:predicted AlkP superfamily pyrophosphatase or phosphodiesterase
MKRLLRTLMLAVAIVTALSAAPPRNPKLVLAIVIDQFRYDYLLRFRDGYHAGLLRLLEHGAVFSDAHYVHAATVTAVGHSTFLTGATPSISGIIANEWYDRESAKIVTSVSDAQTKLVGANPDKPGSSPRRLMVGTVGDELKMQTPASKVISVSIKDRSSILPGGHMADGAYWYDLPSNSWVTSNYYRDTLPDWAAKLNQEKPSAHYAGVPWLPVDAKEGASKPFCTMGTASGSRLCGSIESAPWGNEMIEEFAERAIQGEALGRRSTTDLLAVSFSANDYVGHAAGPDDPSVRDISLRTDRLLGKLLDAAEKSAGIGNVLVVLTADHGVAPLPEVNQARKMPGGRLSSTRMTQKINAALTNRYGPGTWLLAGPAGMEYLNLELIAAKKLDRAEVERTAAEAALSENHIARAYTRTQLLEGSLQQDSISKAFSLSFYAPRSADITVLQDPYYLFAAAGTTHGTPYDYDNHVPVIFFGPGIKPGNYRQRIAVNDIAPTLADLLGVEQPAGSIGRILSEIEAISRQ